MTTHDSSLEVHAIRALQEVLAGRIAASDDITPLTGDVRACLDALTEALQADGIQAVRKTFLALSHDRPWLMKLAAAPAPSTNETEPPPAEPATTLRRIRFVDDDAFENRPQREWLIPKLLPKSGIVLVYGLPRCGKSFLTMSWAMCVASGVPWLGRPVAHGPVAYIAAEGGSGLGPRMKAWKTHHRYSGKSGVKWFDQTLVLTDASNFVELVNALREDLTGAPVLIVLDTFSRCSGGVDEDKASEIARFIAAADMLQQEFHCTVLIVHHTGKDAQRGPRGSSVFLGNVETAINVTATTEGCLVTCTKQKDAREFEPVPLKMHEVSYGPGEDDSSIVLITGSEQVEAIRPESQSTLLACLRGKHLSYADLKQACLDVQQKEGTFKKAFHSLKEAGAIIKVGTFWQVQQGYPVTQPTLPDEDEQADDD